MECLETCWWASQPLLPSLRDTPAIPLGCCVRLCFLSHHLRVLKSYLEIHLLVRASQQICFCCAICIGFLAFNCIRYGASWGEGSQYEERVGLIPVLFRRRSCLFQKEGKAWQHGIALQDQAALTAPSTCSGPRPGSVCRAHGYVGATLRAVVSSLGLWHGKKQSGEWFVCCRVQDVKRGRRKPGRAPCWAGNAEVRDGTSFKIRAS